MKYEVKFEAGIHNMFFEFDNIQDAAAFANIAAAHGTYIPYSEDPRPVKVSINIVNAETEKE